MAGKSAESILELLKVMEEIIDSLSIYMTDDLYERAQLIMAEVKKEISENGEEG